MTADTKLRQLLSILLICFTLTSAEALQRGMNLLVDTKGAVGLTTNQIGGRPWAC